jgi:hypothetical protein
MSCLDPQARRALLGNPRAVRKSARAGPAGGEGDGNLPVGSWAVRLDARQDKPGDGRHPDA